MDLSGATPGQKQVIITLDAPLAIAAGAGSGKTFTLTRRIGYALVGDHGQQPPYIDSIEEVLAITFSKTGAAELKSRIRLLLQEEGLDDQARAVEDAWITTIHGMCARILREHALELGLDPAFSVVEGKEQSELWQSALETVLDKLSDEQGDRRLKRLFELFPETHGPQGVGGLPSYLTTLWEKTLSTPDGFKSVVMPSSSLDLARTLRAMIELGEAYVVTTDQWDGKPTKADQQHLAILHDALQTAQAYQQRISLEGVTFETDDFDMMEYVEMILAFPKTSPAYRNNRPDAAFFAAYRERYAEIARALMQETSHALSVDLLRLVQQVDAEYQCLKGADRLDNTDLLRRCARALEDHPGLCTAYQQQFKLIMVDEFQDTDLLQVAIIDHLSRDKGANVATVGDAQQSIYRFRGADVEVFHRHRQMQQQRHAAMQSLSLPDNFRSHGDILAFVDKIFSRTEFFGEAFLSLNPKGDVNTQFDDLFAETPRVIVEAVESQRGGGSLEDARKKVARSLASRFAQLRDQGARPSDMAVLLGKLTNVAVYARALAEEGFECIIAGGSVFAQAKEVHIVEACLACIADEDASIALYQVLSSPLFNLSDSALFVVANFDASSDGLPRSASFARRFWFLTRQLSRGGDVSVRDLFASAALSSPDLGELMRCLELMSRCAAQAEKASVYKALHDLITDAGWFYRLQEEGAEGMAVAANLFKALDIVSEWEHEQKDLLQIATDFSAFLEVSKQSPGVLATSEGDFVQIMTIHASKGLEFDHVAVAEINSGIPKSSPLKIDTYGEQILFSLTPKLSDAASKNYKELCAGLDEGADLDDLLSGSFLGKLQDLSSADMSALLDARIVQAELDDAERLLYVALTRACKSLCLCLTISNRGAAKFEYASHGVVGLIADALAWEKSANAKQYLFDYGGSAPALVHHEVLTQKLEEQLRDPAEERPFVVPVFTEVDMRTVNIASPRADVVSYSSIAPDHRQGKGGEAGDHDKFDTVEPSAGSDVETTLLDDAFLSDEEMFPEDVTALVKQQSATALGTAFHRLAQRAIESRTEVGVVPELPASTFISQVKLGSLSQLQEKRLDEATQRWFASDLCKRFFACEHIYAEVPFMLEIGSAERPLYLEGEIDGLAVSEADKDHAFFIDYKTGGSDEELPEQLHEKHLLQARCYALVLMRQGFKTVEAHFVRVERMSKDDPAQPQVVPYRFTVEDLATLEEAVLSAYEARRS